MIQQDLALAISACTQHENWEKDRRAEAVRHARKAFKRIRATADLLHGHADESVLIGLERNVRDLGRRLSSIRDRAVVEKTVAEFERTTKGKKKKRNIRIMCSILASSHPVNLIDHRSRQQVIEEVADDARKIQTEVTAIAIEKFHKEDVLKRVGRSWRRSRTRFRSRRMFLDGNVEFLHDTRKRVITLQQQMEVIQLLDPKPIARLITRLHDVATTLGEDHDLVVLSKAMASERDRFHELTPILQLESEIAKRRSRTQKYAFKIGSAVLKKKGRELGERLMRRWK